jgi:uncharacterized protein
MKVILDTNVLLSAAWRDRLPEKVVLYIATAQDCQWIATAEIIREYIDVLRRPKFNLSDELTHLWSELIDMRTLLVASPPVDLSTSRDPKDAIFLAAALACNADFLIAGDRDVLHSNASMKTRIISVADFAEEISRRNR